jgi:proteasome lid subunit RPN8/RPN11
MLQVLVSTANQFLADLNRSFRRERHSAVPEPLAGNKTGVQYQPLQRILLTDGVGRTLFEEFAAHRAQSRGDEETGWVLMGLREPAEAIVLATLPAGAERDASVAHVRFNSQAQAVGSRIIRQADRRLTILGVVHTHPGSLRHPSDADYRGDCQWVNRLRGGEGVFGIGTADGKPSNGDLYASQPRPHVQAMGELTLSWYALRRGDPNYRPLAVELTLGPDLARPLHSIWSVVERHADRLDRLYRQQAGITFHLPPGDSPTTLGVNVPLAEPDETLRVLLDEREVRYYLVRNGELLAADCPEERVDRGVYLLLAELAASS